MSRSMVPSSRARSSRGSRAPLVVHGSGAAARIASNHVRVFFGAVFGSVVGGALASSTALTGEPEVLATAAVVAVVLAVLGCGAGIGVALRRHSWGWVVAVATPLVLALEYQLIRGLLPSRDWVESLATSAWAGLIVGSLALIPQVVLGVVEATGWVTRRT